MRSRASEGCLAVSSELNPSLQEGGMDAWVPRDKQKVTCPRKWKFARFLKASPQICVGGDSGQGLWEEILRPVLHASCEESWGLQLLCVTPPWGFYREELLWSHLSSYQEHLTHTLVSNPKRESLAHQAGLQGNCYCGRLRVCCLAWVTGVWCNPSGWLPQDARSESTELSQLASVK